MNETVTKEFCFTNLGGEPLIIDKVASTCGCAAGLVSGKVFLPNQEGQLRVTWSASTTGRRQHSAYIFSNSSHDKVVSVSITGHVIQELELAPRTLDFGDILVGQRDSKSLRVIRTEDELRPKILSVEVSSEQFSVALHPESQARREERVLVELNAGSNPGTLESVVTIHTSSKWQPMIEIPVYANVVSRVILRPESIFFGPVNCGDEKVRNIMISSRDDRPFAITAVSCNEPSVRCRIHKEAANKYKLEIFFCAQGRPRLVSSQIELTTSILEEPLVRVPMCALVRSRAKGGE